MNSKELSVLAVAAGYCLDLLLGDPHWLYHPVRLIGKWISLAEKGLRSVFPEGEKGERAAGAVMAFSTVAVTAGAAALLLAICGRAGAAASFLCRCILAYWLFATRSLRDESRKVYDRLADNDPEGARAAVSMIVGRDTQRLDEAGITKAAVETVAENTSDGIIAPMLYLVLGGPVLGWAYKAVNTMDSMVGYKNERYLNFGRFAARLDDAVNYIPARLSALLMIAACLPAGLDAANAARIFRRDRYNHASPNSAQTEAAMAGALHVQLAGDAWYFGTLHRKPTIGDPDRPVEPEDIRRSHRLLYMTSAAGLVLFLAVRMALPW